MTIQDIGSIGELVAAIATVATLLYLAIQVRQANSSDRSDSAAFQNQSDITLSVMLAQDAEVNRIFWDGLADPSSLGERDRLRLDAIINAFLSNCEMTWRLHNEGSIDEGRWAAQLSFLQWLSHQPGFIAHWAIWRSTTAAGFAQVVDLASNADNPVPLELLAAQQRAESDSS